MGRTQVWTPAGTARHPVPPFTHPKLNLTVTSDKLKSLISGAEVLLQKSVQLDSGESLAMAVTKGDHGQNVFLICDAKAPVFLHWGLARRAYSAWERPSEDLLPEGSKIMDDHAIQTPFQSIDSDLQSLTLHFAKPDIPRGISFVLHQPELNRWFKSGGKDLFLPIAKKSPHTDLSAIQERIVEKEMGPHGWTLMHRFNLCHELMDDAHGDREGWITLFVWLRFSAMRQLDWQRNYNTKPRELSHAQDRLTLKLAEAWIAEQPHRDLIRLMLAGLGRGGDGQRIRDEILQIMHRHHIKEVGGTWMEQWHQKLHNNTTPDDIVICEAYLAFLHSNGDAGRYFETLESQGVTRQRLESLERPITQEPEWHPHLKEALLHDFGHYLNLLKSVHSGTDLTSSAEAGWALLNDDEKGKVDAIRREQGNPHVDAVWIIRTITEVRCGLGERLNHESDPGRLRNGLYLDLALEDTLRQVIERSVNSHSDGSFLYELLGLTIQNVQLSGGQSELGRCGAEWQNLPHDNRFSHDWSLHAYAILDRLKRALAETIDFTYRELQPKAESLGKAFEAEPWTIDSFSETVVRGRPAFAASQVIHFLEPALRRSANLGDWQVISPNPAFGEVVVVDSLRSVQGRRFERPTVLVIDKVYGDEEPPEGVCAVITSSTVDLVSHVAVRTRNAQILFVTCHDKGNLETLQKMEGRTVAFTITPAGDVIYKEEQRSDQPRNINQDSNAKVPVTTRAIKKSNTPLRRHAFNDKQLGGKSNNLKILAEKLPEWIQVPKSVALPFGTFESVLEDKQNKDVADRHRGLLNDVESDSESVLPQIRAGILDLKIPGELMKTLRNTLQEEGMVEPGTGDRMEDRIKQVWASKWNNRAWYSRRAHQWPDDAIFMAVLIQEVIEADYAFVIHTANPFTGDQDELYAEIVLGLGETLVGNYPGRAMGFVSSKTNPDPEILAYPGKSVGLYGSGLIFRSDSNAEDLEGFAGAGLYESVLLEPPREVNLNYTREPLVWDESFRNRLLTGITRLGLEIEKAYGTPQDIEGVFSNDRFFVVQTRPQVGLKA